MLKRFINIKMNNLHELILPELKSGKYSLSKLEELLNIPKNTLEQAKIGKRKIPKKYLGILANELKI